MRVLVPTFVEESSRKLGIAADLFRIQSDGPLAQVDGRIRPEILAMEAVHPLYIGVGKAGVGKCESRVRVYRLPK